MTNLYSRYWKKWEISVNELFIYYLITLAYYKWGGGGVFINRKSHKTYENLYSHSHFPDWSLCRSILVPGPYI